MLPLFPVTLQLLSITSCRTHVHGRKDYYTTLPGLCIAIGKLLLAKTMLTFEDGVDEIPISWIEAPF